MKKTKQMSIRKKLNTESAAGIICTMPFIIGFLLFMIVPMGISLYYSFCNYDILSAPKWCGLDNYIKMFTDDPKFWKSIAVTFYFALVSVPLRLIFALIVAMILVKSSKASAFTEPYIICLPLLEALLQWRFCGKECLQQTV